MQNVAALSDLVEALRCSADAVPSHKHSDQSRGERRRRMLRTRGTCTDSDSGSSLHVVGCEASYCASSAHRCTSEGWRFRTAQEQGVLKSFRKPAPGTVVAYKQPIVL